MLIRRPFWGAITTLETLYNKIQLILWVFFCRLIITYSTFLLLIFSLFGVLCMFLVPNCFLSLLFFVLQQMPSLPSDWRLFPAHCSHLRTFGSQIWFFSYEDYFKSSNCSFLHWSNNSFVLSIPCSMVQ